MPDTRQYAGIRQGNTGRIRNGTVFPGFTSERRVSTGMPVTVLNDTAFRCWYSSIYGGNHTLSTIPVNISPLCLARQNPLRIKDISWKYDSAYESGVVAPRPKTFQHIIHTQANKMKTESINDRRVICRAMNAQENHTSSPPFFGDDC